MFRQLTPEETIQFKQWARDNYKCGEPIKGVWHPSVQAECVVMNSEWAWQNKGNATKDDLFPPSKQHVGCGCCKNDAEVIAKMCGCWPLHFASKPF